MNNLVSIKFILFIITSRLSNNALSTIIPTTCKNNRPITDPYSLCFNIRQETNPDEPTGNIEMISDFKIYQEVIAFECIKVGYKCRTYTDFLNKLSYSKQETIEANADPLECTKMIEQYNKTLYYPHYIRTESEFECQSTYCCHEVTNINYKHYLLPVSAIFDKINKIFMSSSLIGGYCNNIPCTPSKPNSMIFLYYPDSTSIITTKTIGQSLSSNRIKIYNNEIYYDGSCVYKIDQKKYVYTSSQQLITGDFITQQKECAKNVKGYYDIDVLNIDFQGYSNNAILLTNAVRMIKCRQLIRYLSQNLTISNDDLSWTLPQTSINGYSFYGQDGKLYLCDSIFKYYPTEYIKGWQLTSNTYMCFYSKYNFSITPSLGSNCLLYSGLWLSGTYWTSLGQYQQSRINRLTNYYSKYDPTSVNISLTYSLDNGYNRYKRDLKDKTEQNKPYNLIEQLQTDYGQLGNLIFSVIVLSGTFFSTWGIMGLIYVSTHLKHR